MTKNKMIETLLKAIGQEDIDQVTAILETKIDINRKCEQTSWFPLMSASEMGNYRILKLLLQHNADVQLIDDYGNTALHIAVDSAIDSTNQARLEDSNVPIDCIEELLKHNADINCPNKEGQTPKEWAKNYKSQKVLKLFNDYEKGKS